MEASASNGPDDVKTFTGRSLEEVLPKIREELGPDAIVLRRREGLTGGVGGFFQRPYVEVEARASADGQGALEIRTDRTTPEGLASPAVQALFEQATPFADALAAAARGTRTPDDFFASTVTEPPRGEGAFTFGEGMFEVADGEPEPSEQEEAEAPGFDIPTAPACAGASSDPLLPDRLPAADQAEQRLVASGLSPALAADIVSEAVVHGLPFASPPNLEQLVRNVLARRIQVFRKLGTEPRTIALVGGGGSGKTSTVANIAASYVAAGADVAVVSLRGDTTLSDRLQPLGVAVIQAQDGEQAKQRRGAARPLITLIDTPAVGLNSTAAEVERLAAELEQLEVTEVHLTLPATLSAAAAGEVSEALAPLHATHVVLSHADETKRPGAPIEVALSTGRPLSYICAREGVRPADPAALAQQLLP